MTINENKYWFYIGIEPGYPENNIAIWNSSKKVFTLLDSLPLFKNDIKTGLFNLLCFYAPSKQIQVTISTGNINNIYKSNKISKLSGIKDISNQERCKIIVEICEYLKIPYILSKSKESILDNNQFINMTKYDGYTNKHNRNAAMLVYGL